MKEGTTSDEGVVHPLSAVGGIPPSALEALRGQWIESVEQVIAIAAVPESRAGLGRLLGMTPEALDTLLTQLRSVVGVKAAARLEAAAPGGPLGARLTEEQEGRAGQP